MLASVNKPRSNAEFSTVRIIAGRWRGRKLRFRADGVRPTGDRVRETLFNWLGPHLPDARCLDLFAGTGVLGLEALSRGAAGAVLVEHNRQVADQIGTQIDALEAAGAKLVRGDATQLALARHGPFDVVFLDPPFADNDSGPTLTDLCTLLESSGALADNCRVYLEMDRGQALPDVPANWQIRHEKTAGQVRYALAERQA